VRRPRAPTERVPALRDLVAVLRDVAVAEAVVVVVAAPALDV
jgi:hypothetical protein